MNIKIKFLLSILLLTSFAAFVNPGDKSPKITSGEVTDHIKYLASDELAGRFPGTDGDKLTVEYIVNEFEEYGITPAGEDGYLQPFDYISEIKLGKDNSLSIGNGELIKGSGEEFTTLYLSANGTAQGNIVFVGYGINAPELNYNDYAGIDLKGKIALMLMYSPGYNNPHDNPFSKYERLRIKCAAAKEQGAAGIIVVKGPESGEDELVKLRMSGPGETMDIPVMNVKRSYVEYIFTNSKKMTLSEVQKNIDSLRTPISFEFGGGMAQLKADLVRIKALTNNVIGKIEGKDPVLKNEYIVIGAHMDHLGDGLKYGSLHDSHVAEIHNGADDNASGVAGILELAQYYSTKKKDLKRSIIFMTFSGEEAGLIGSAYFTKSELMKKYNIVSMINLDMVGRLTDNKLTIGGTGTSSIWQGLLDSLNKTYNFTAAYNKDGYGPSDHASFYGKDIPVLFFFTGLHKDYHKPSDDWQLINADGEAKVLNMVVSIVNYVNTLSAKPDFIKVTEEKKETNMGFRVTLGVIPDYSSTKEGLEITGVKSGGVAEKAGLQAGDVITKLGQYEIKNIYDYTDALTKFKPGEESEVTFVRGTETKTVKFTFAK
ncbi:MAG TPA: M20/M25/M40 family metallo-hydrolase [Ignavibacteria bacterium]|nr:M20/M25/M40 family metallo-hydrolase [Ignavibacteria bacterium]HMQ99093.1 M20/M25/M40 family metallo-hydrolase [Ignavibacteria bacterium]